MHTQFREEWEELNADLKEWTRGGAAIAITQTELEQFGWTAASPTWQDTVLVPGMEIYCYD